MTAVVVACQQSGPAYSLLSGDAGGAVVGGSSCLPASLLNNGDAGTSDAGFVVDAGPPSRSCPGTQVLATSLDPAYMTAPLVGPMPADSTVLFDVGLPIRNQDAAVALGQAVSDPSNPCYGHYLSDSQWEAAFSPTEADYQTAIAFFAASGFTIDSTFSDRELFVVSGTVAQVEQTFCVQMNYYLRPDGSQFYSADRTPSINLSVQILAVSGLDDSFQSMEE